MESVLKTKQLIKTFHGKRAVNCVDMDIEKGEIYGFIGKNGAGKTTLMRMVTGSSLPTSGSIELFGSTDIEEGRKRIGSLVDYPCLFQSKTAVENMKLNAILSGGADEKTINRILFQVGLIDTGKKKVKSFSLGMKQRLGIGISLLANPEFLVLDEPNIGLDPTGMKETRNLLLSLNKEYGTTILISSHMLDELSKIATRYGIINDGYLIEELSAEEIQKRSRRGLKISVDNAQKAAEIITANLTACEFKIASANLIYLYSNYGDSGKIIQILSAGGVAISEIMYETDTLDEYFISRIGE